MWTVQLFIPNRPVPTTRAVHHVATLAEARQLLQCADKVAGSPGGGEWESSSALLYPGWLFTVECVSCTHTMEIGPRGGVITARH